MYSFPSLGKAVDLPTFKMPFAIFLRYRSYALAVTFVCLRGNVYTGWDIIWVFHSLLARGADRAVRLWSFHSPLSLFLGSPLVTDFSPDWRGWNSETMWGFIVAICRFMKLFGIVKGIHLIQVLVVGSSPGAKIRIKRMDRLLFLYQCFFSTDVC